MQALITITTGEQGSPVVSARELYEFLEVKTKFADWLKGRVIRYGFLEGTDYVTIEAEDSFSENSEKLKVGRTATDYALTLDMAKELAMVERTAKGKQARQYFIEAEKQLRQVIATPAPTTEQVLIQLVSQSHQLLAGQQQQLEQLRAEVEQIKAGVRPAVPAKPARLKATPVLPLPVGPPTKKSNRLGSLRPLIHQKVNEYCERHEVSQGETYNYLYRRLSDVYGVNVYRLIRTNGESILDTLERYGHLDRLYSLIMGELTYTE